jgi:hypothetical protein
LLRYIFYFSFTYQKCRQKSYSCYYPTDDGICFSVFHDFSFFLNFEILPTADFLQAPLNGQNAYRSRTRRDADTQLEPPRRVHRTTVQEKDGKYSVVCTIGDMSSDVFRMELAMPDKLTAPTTILPICS